MCAMCRNFTVLAVALVILAGCAINGETRKFDSRLVGIWDPVTFGTNAARTKKNAKPDLIHDSLKLEANGFGMFIASERRSWKSGGLPFRWQTEDDRFTLTFVDEEGNGGEVRVSKFTLRDGVLDFEPSPGTSEPRSYVLGKP